MKRILIFSLVAWVAAFLVTFFILSVVNAEPTTIYVPRSDATGTPTVQSAGVAVTVSFGSAGSTTAQTVVTGQIWVHADSVIVCVPTGIQTDTNLRPEGAEDAALEGLSISVSNRVVGVGFTLSASPANGLAYNNYVFHCVGAA